MTRGLVIIATTSLVWLLLALMAIRAIPGSSSGCMRRNERKYHRLRSVGYESWTQVPIVCIITKRAPNGNVVECKSTLEVERGRFAPFFLEPEMSDDELAKYRRDWLEAGRPDPSTWIRNPTFPSTPVMNIPTTTQSSSSGGRIFPWAARKFRHRDYHHW